MTQLNTTDLQKSIDEINQMIIDNKNKKITIYDFAKDYRLVEYTIAVIIGISITYIIRDISINIINPIISSTIFYNHEIVKLFGIEFNIEKIIEGIIFALLSLAILYFLIRYIFKDVGENIIIENRYKDLNNRLYQQQNLLFQKQNLNLLNDIKTYLQNK